ncbi:biotin--[acetyl-CoA-carboxylase] ligase [Aestuariivirga litoralis]|uniref:biotin--[acetyl-CoA-carboxylase] ligase n=1 Tax=Aestuariivirga litoralis TaxID=2650924 RepID=UPI0018C5D4C6|nr:biotin--[acetyl-CoA-carboxylase] ligase [Aestuariivirga litoralis]
MRIERLSSIDSTNLEAQRRAVAGEPGPLWLVAVEQTAGKGRLGRTWISKPGNLYSTLIWPTAAALRDLSQLSFVAALGVSDAASKFAPANSVSLKWPNDILLNGSKFCGILVESLKPGLVAIGIGINIAHVPDGLPYKAEKLTGAADDTVFEQLNLSLSYWLKIWDEGEGFAAISAAWESRCHHIGKAVSVDGLQGTFKGLGPDGALLLEKSTGETKPIYAGDVRVEYQAP